MMEITSILFYTFGLAMCASGLLVITLRQPVFAILFLVKAIVCASVLWMMMGAEFLSLALIFVYVGAVMTLFLFVAMMLNATFVRDQFWKSALTWLGVLVSSGIIWLMVKAMVGGTWAKVLETPMAEDISNIQALGHVLYHAYALPVELASMLLLVAMVSAVVLTLEPKKKASRAQSIDHQVNVQAKDRIELIDLREER